MILCSSPCRSLKEGRQATPWCWNTGRQNKLRSTTSALRNAQVLERWHKESPSSNQDGFRLLPCFLLEAGGNVEQVSHHSWSGLLLADRVGGVQFWLGGGTHALKQPPLSHSLTCYVPGQGQPGPATEQMAQNRYRAGPCSWASWTIGVSRGSKDIFSVCNHHISP